MLTFNLFRCADPSALVLMPSLVQHARRAVVYVIILQIFLIGNIYSQHNVPMWRVNEHKTVD